MLYTFKMYTLSSSTLPLFNAIIALLCVEPKNMLGMTNWNAFGGKVFRGKIWMIAFLAKLGSHFYCFTLFYLLDDKGLELGESFTTFKKGLDLWQDSWHLWIYINETRSHSILLRWARKIPILLNSEFKSIRICILTKKCNFIANLSREYSKTKKISVNSTFYWFSEHVGSPWNSIFHS